MIQGIAIKEVILLPGICRFPDWLQYPYYEGQVQCIPLAMYPYPQGASYGSNFTLERRIGAYVVQ
jgi:hypothetical protein